MLIALPAGKVWATDFDITLNDSQRRSEVASLCPSLLKGGVRQTPLNGYHKGLCLLYGIGAKPQLNKALPLLRAAANDGLPDAQLALADVLQGGKESEQIEALVWYLRAERAGDARATIRYGRLEQRIAIATAAAQNKLPDPPPGTIVNPTAPQLQALFRQGYHCHFLALGQKWCHNTND